MQKVFWIGNSKNFPMLLWEIFSYGRVPYPKIVNYI